MVVLRPVKYSRKCIWCHAVVTLDGNEINFKGPNGKICPNCGNTVFFTSDRGQLDLNVKVEYGLVPEEVKPKEEKKKQGELF